MLVMRFHKKDLFYFIYCTQSPKMFCPLYMYIQLSFWGFIWTQESLRKWIKYDCWGECCAEYNDCCWLWQRWSWVILYPNSVLNHSGQLILYTIKWSIFSLISSYDTTMEQISVIRQLMELYIIQDDEFHYGSVMLEFGVALHDLGDKDLEEEKWVYCLCVFWFSMWHFVLHLCTCKWL